VKPKSAVILAMDPHHVRATLAGRARLSAMLLLQQSDPANTTE